jgi:anti-sigma B factor antagonist
LTEDYLTCARTVTKGITGVNAQKPAQHQRLEAGNVDIETKTQDGVKLVKLKGRLNMGPPLDRFNATMNELLGQGQNRIVLDLEEVPTIDSSGIGMLVRHLTTAKQSGGAIRLLKPSKFTLQTLKMVGLLNLFTTFDDSNAAVASFQ